MAYNKDEYASITAYPPLALKARMERIRAHDRRYAFTRQFEEALLAWLPGQEHKFGIKATKPAKKESQS